MNQRADGGGWQYVDVKGGGNWQTESSKTYRIYKERKKNPSDQSGEHFQIFFFFASD